MISQSAPQVSVVVPAYNTAKYIAEALDSVFAQTFRDFEVVVVNDGSPDTDQLETALAPFMDRIRYFRRPHSGSGATRNFGIEQARGKFISLLDSDDIWEPEYLEVMTGLLQRDPGLDIVYPNAVMFGIPSVDGVKYMDMHPWDGEPVFSALVRRECCVFGLVTARRESLLRTGLYDVAMPCCEDFELWLRAVKMGCRLGFTKQVLVRYRRHQKSLSANHIATTKYNIYSPTKTSQSFPLTAEEKGVVEGELKLLHATLALLEGKRALLDRNYELAISKLSLGNEYFHSFKTKAAIAMLRVIPGLLRMIFDFRNRLVQSPVSE